MKYIVECKPDKLLVKFLINVPKKSIIHAANKTEVIKTLLKMSDDAIGIIDEDPWSSQPSHLKKFELKENFSNYDLSILQDNQTKKKIVVVRPRLEDWLLRAGKESEISFKRYKLPETGKDLHKAINTNLEKLQTILNELLKSKNARLFKLKEILNK